MNKYHHPVHKFEDNATYFLTARTYNNQPTMKGDEKKQLFLDSLKSGFQHEGINLSQGAGINPLGFHCDDSLMPGFQPVGNSAFRLIAWVILDNHYHIEFEAKESKILPKIINQLHGKLSCLFNKMDNMRGRKIFQNYWDTCIREEKDLWTRFNYIHHNPVKHGYSRRMEDYTFSSFGYYLGQKGREWLDDCFGRYPVIDFTLKEED